jgi:hypothetical protein
MVAGAVAGNISREATQPSGNILVEAMRGLGATGSTFLATAADAAPVEIRKASTTHLNSADSDMS